MIDSAEAQDVNMLTRTNNFDTLRITEHQCFSLKNDNSCNDHDDCRWCKPWCIADGANMRMSKLLICYLNVKEVCSTFLQLNLLEQQQQQPARRSPATFLM